MAMPDRKLITREILLGFWKVHILHHAAQQPVVGQWILGELRRHGYDISPGTLYPLLKRMERNGWLKCEVEPGGGPRARRYYDLTREGRAVLDIVIEMIAELHHEVIEEGKGRTVKRWLVERPVGKSAGEHGRGPARRAAEQPKARRALASSRRR
jgi:DNA-binding PadR family transcriptional regulator